MHVPAVKICCLFSPTKQKTCSTNAFPHRLMDDVCVNIRLPIYPRTGAHAHSPDTSVFTHNNCEMKANLQTLRYFYCCTGTLVNAV